MIFNRLLLSRNSQFNCSFLCLLKIFYWMYWVTWFFLCLTTGICLVVPFKFEWDLATSFNVTPKSFLNSYLVIITFDDVLSISTSEINKKLYDHLFIFFLRGGPFLFNLLQKRRNPNLVIGIWPTYRFTIEPQCIKKVHEICVQYIKKPLTRYP